MFKTSPGVFLGILRTFLHKFALKRDPVHVLFFLPLHIPISVVTKALISVFSPVINTPSYLYLEAALNFFWF